MVDIQREKVSIVEAQREKVALVHLYGRLNNLMNPLPKLFWNIHEEMYDTSNIRQLKDSILYFYSQKPVF